MKTMLNYDEEIRAREELKNAKLNLFVSAGAGAGKTTSLVGRITYGFTIGIKPSEVVAITFTNKSAEDLRKKIIEKLDELKMTEISEQIDEMHISTIHKFCDDILKENAIDANLSPDFKILAPEDDLLRKDAIFKMFVKNLKNKALEAFEEYSISNYQIITDIKSLYYPLTSFIERISQDKIYLPASGFDISSIKNELQAKSQKIVALVNRYEQILIDAFNDYKKENNDVTIIYNTSENILSRFKHPDIDVDLFDALMNPKKDSIELKSPFNGSKLRANVIKPYHDEFKSDLTLFNEEINQLLKDKYDLYAKSIFGLAYMAYEYYLDMISQDINSVSNDQLIYKTYELLKNNPKITLKLQKKYKHLYVDEYQDTDHLQMEIAKLLTIDNDHFNDSALYVVGDPKQSIYRFRGAEPQVFFDTRKLFNTPDTKIFDLNINFRSNSKILDWVNEKFALVRLTDDEYQPMLVKKENIIEEDEKLIAGVYRYLGTEPIDIATLIKSIKKNYLIRRLKSKEVDGKRCDYFTCDTINYRDFMVILYKIEPMASYVKEFTKQGIPVKIAGEAKFNTEFIVRAYISLYKGLVNRGELAEALVKETLKAVYFEYIDLHDALKADEIINGLAGKLKEDTKDLTPLALALYLVDHLEWFIYNKELEDFNLNSVKSKLYQMIEEVLVNDFYNGPKLAERFEKYINSKIEYESLMDDKADTVHLINVHKSKGLDAPIVIWICQDKSSKWKMSTVKKDGILYLSGSPKDGSYASGLCLYSHYDAIDKIAQDDLDELARLEYVGATRAKEALIFAEKVAKNQNDTPKLFTDERYNLHELPTLEIDDEPSEKVEKEVVDYKIREHSLINDEPALKIKTPSSYESLSQTFINHLNQKQENNNRPKGNIFGTIMHRAFELLAQGNNEKIVYQVMNEFQDLILDSEKIKIEKFLRALILQTAPYLNNLINDGYSLYPEMTFSYQKDGTIINGSIDLLCLKENNALIIDYKSDEADYLDDDIFKKVLTERYFKQIALYEEAVERLLKCTNIKKKIIYFKNYDPDKEIVSLKELELN